MPNKRFLLIYADKSRAHITIPERDSLLVHERIRKINDYSYEYLAPLKTNSFSNLGLLGDRFKPLTPVQRNLGMGTLLFELKDKLFFDNGETTAGMIVRMQIAEAS